MAAPPEAPKPKQARSRATRDRILDAAVEQLLDSGYTGLSVQAVSQRAGVSRGATQSHFPQRALLVAEAVNRLGRRRLAILQEALRAAPRGRTRVSVALDVIFDQYSSDHFAVIIELSLAARKDLDLREVVEAEERLVSRELNEVGEEVLGSVDDRWATVLAMVRGLAILKLFGHPPSAVDRQWRSSRREIVALLD